MSPVPTRSVWYRGHFLLYHPSMFDANVPENYGPDDGGEGGTGNVSEQAREQARDGFAAAQQASLQQLQRDEKKSKKRDDGVAQIILQFLSDVQRQHLATLIARLVAINCPTPFILGVLSLINEQCRAGVEEYLKDKDVQTSENQSLPIALQGERGLDASANTMLVMWITRMDHVLQTDPQTILGSLLIDQNNIDGTVLQLTTFVLQTFLAENGKNAEFENLQALSIGVLQSLFEPHVRAFPLPNPLP